MKMLENDLNIEFRKGDTCSFSLNLRELGQELESVNFICKKNRDDDTVLFKKSLDDGITLDSVEIDDYFYKVRIAPEDTKNLEPGKYYYYLQIAANGDVWTLLNGILTLEL